MVLKIRNELFIDEAAIWSEVEFMSLFVDSWLKNNILRSTTRRCVSLNKSDGAFLFCFRFLYLPRKESINMLVFANSHWGEI